jgi:alkylated DNA repair dioxygenase AlkB
MKATTKINILTNSIKNKAIHVISSKGQVIYYNNFLLNKESIDLYNKMLHNIDWVQHPIRMFGKTYLQPRLIAFQGDKKITYRYSNTSLEAEEWSAEIRFIKIKLQKIFGLNFNCVLINQYRDGQDSMGWHSDNEKELGSSPLIASVSLGAERKIQFRNINDHSQKNTVMLNNGSLLIMSGETQNHWQHQISKSKKIKTPRINLTFRTILKNL